MAVEYGAWPMKPAISAMSRRDLQALCRQAGVKAIHAERVQAALFRYAEQDMSAIEGLPKGFAQWLMRHTSWPRARLLDLRRAEDGTRKMLLAMPGGGEVESVLIPAQGRITQCISTQIGCAMGCAFCLTARMGLRRNLDVAEMMAQFWQARWLLGEYPRNVVLMGMGEPLHNYDAVARFVHLLTDPAGIALSPRRVTVSTAGLVPAIERMCEDALPCNLAVSLNASNDALRDRIMPVNRKYPLAMLLRSVRRFAAGGGRRRVLIEYVLMAGVNDELTHADELAVLLQGLPCTINLLPLNMHVGTKFRRPSDAQVVAFRNRLLDAGFVAVVRASRGDDISAACGQLHRRQWMHRQRAQAAE